jgi:AcrR family transcriptional regulator
MRATTKKRAPKAAPGDPVWNRPEPRQRPAPRPLSREQIVQAAIAIADAEGLEAVSLRNVANKLRAGPMRLYTYTSTKEGLLDLMVDEVYAEIVRAGTPSGDWRRALRTFAERRRSAAQRHPWFAELLGGRPHLGPNALAHLEAALAALSRGGRSDIDAVLTALQTVDAYVIGSLRSEAAEAKARRESGIDKRQWQLASYPYLQNMLSSGDYPMLTKVMREAAHPTPEKAFQRGLDAVLDGVAALLT